MYLLLILVILFLLTSVALLAMLFLGLRDTILIRVPFVSTRPRAIRQIVDALSLSDDSVLYEPGSGNANILKMAILKTPGARGIGIEKGYLPYLISRVNTRDLPITIHYQDILATDFGAATHIYCYLSGTLMNQLSKKIRTECREGTRIVSCDFQLPDFTPIRIIPLEAGADKLSRTLYIYETSTGTDD
jgi:hypothetical protein